MTTSSRRGDELLSAVARLHRWATRNASLDLPTAQGRVLALVAELGPSRIGDLAAADHCSQPTMTTQVQRVEARGWVTREADPADARAWLVGITPEGRQALRTARAARGKAVQPLLDSLSREDAAVLERAAEIMHSMVSAARG
ncbi:MarR family transcriptional regulator [Luteipulveratus sp. YIM 133132]|uniref:MarR family transcriptional regulator n=1 Tax=Luteipulveratus flavus TaxID=3031728 RepID=A0ABT6C4N2_9MICO|nr:MULTISPECIES: MarR family transcriptional regulator [unclassified Luteipulveratus]MDE9366552.1 MarR family transcriptional regulator [Luteipulveratus sp. YIM 133132]MDF8263503.1 MarR family transcriptional regulator [Luteipulveratus sp. YIM 133296]